ncbi:MAG: helix-turn-helix transcriptional regulator [Clostridia bacterium]
MRAFSDRLKELRMEQGLSILSLSKLTGISNASICRWENNVCDIKGEELVILARFFDCTTDYLLGLEV